ncbi:ABC-2 transporter permease [Methanocella arvoryzae]|uniref:Predicted ABC-type transport system, permease component n=1 Tax=Methanocella arvoryzae (strain DSM 22066 / NBRC 105507 / MRE50) TaxID=351160 RepID=Q0W194_METAR|nr:ABC-2 transporter permease [Methanocella arvoryzae]CAJ37849.1 predicted ABC-type transport system, permease component [Methanocella arvoryzae MRE50]
MVNIIWEIARKELLAYFTGKSAMLRNLIMLGIFSIVPIMQINNALMAGGYSSAALSQSLEVYLLFSSFYALVMASTIAVMAFPYEKEQKTIEYLFTLPLKDYEILAGKMLAAVIAGIGGLAFVMAVILGCVLALNGHLIQWTTPFPTLSLVLTVLVIAPMIVVLSVLIIVAISGFISNARMTYMPVYVIAGIVMGLTFARAELGEYVMLANAVIIVLLAAAIAVTFAVSVKTFNRERIAGN